MVVTMIGSSIGGIMVRGLYTAYTGMANEQKRLDVISNNLANAATIGYKKDSVTSQSFDHLLTIKVKDASESYVDRPVGSMSLGVKIGEVYTSFHQGSLRSTNNTFDLAIEGKGFFALGMTNANGDEITRYTRNGSFTLTSDGYLVDKSGNTVLSNGDGAIQLPTDGTEISIDTMGNIFADGSYIAQLQLADFADYDYLSKVGDTMYEPVDGAELIDANGLVKQGYTEQSNVNTVSEMVEMINITRAYEANQKVIKAMDTTLDLAVNSVGKV